MFVVKGIVFSFSRSRKNRRIRLPDLGLIFKRYSVTIVFTLMLFSGLIFGAVYAHNSDSSMIESLDFLFTTNLDARLTQGVAGTFCACFASDFVFLLGVYFFGLALWGSPFIAATVLFKGFGTGLTAGYLSMTYSLSGVGFYLLVLLPGTFLFCIALVLFSASAFQYSRNVFVHTVSKTTPVFSLRQEATEFSSRFLSFLTLTFFASALDTALWTLFAGTFKF